MGTRLPQRADSRRHGVRSHDRSRVRRFDHSGDGVRHTRHGASRMGRAGRQGLFGVPRASRAHGLVPARRESDFRRAVHDHRPAHRLLVETLNEKTRMSAR